MFVLDTSSLPNINLISPPGPILLGAHPTTDVDTEKDWRKLPVHKDESQVHLDVNRAFVYYPRSKKGPDEDDSSDSRSVSLDTLKTQLSDLITCTLRRHSSLNYFQGYHDIAQVLLLVLRPSPVSELPDASTKVETQDDATSSATALTERCLARLSLLRIRDFMLPSISATNAHLEVLPRILYTVDADLCHRLTGLQPFFALAATLTMFAHDIQDYSAIARLFDFLLSQEAVASIYLFAAIVLRRKKELLEIDPSEPEMMYAVLCKLPEPLDLEGLIQASLKLYELHPPQSLPFGAWKRVSSYSVLKTTRKVTDIRSQSLEEGEKWMALQAREIERAEQRAQLVRDMRDVVHRYRRPASLVIIAVLVGVVSISLGRQQGSQALLGKWVHRQMLWPLQRTLRDRLGWPR